MSMSGITVSEDIVELYNGDFKIRKKHAYFTLTINKKGEKGEEVQLETCGDPLPSNCTEEDCSEAFNKMKEGLKDDQPKFIVFDLRFKSLDGRDVDQLALITWISDSCPVKLRMKYSSTKEVLPRKLPGVKSIQANDLGDLDFKSVVVDLRKSK